MKRTRTLAMVLGALVLGAVLGAFWQARHAPAMKGGDASKTASEEGAPENPCPGGEKPLFWRNPMNPKITSPTFQKDEMGMPYIPVCPNEAGGKGVVVKIDPAVVQTIGVRTAKAMRRKIARTIEAPGTLAWAEPRIYRLSPRVSGWVERLFVDETGARVRKGERLAEIYSPELAASADELRMARRAWDALSPSASQEARAIAKAALEGARKRLLRLGLAPREIAAIERGALAPDRLVIRAPASGIVTKIGAREGERIAPQKTLFTIVDDAELWVFADFYEGDAPWVKPGDHVRIEVPDLPGRTLSGKIAFLYPWVEGRARVVRARIVLANPERRLRAGEFVRVRVQARAHEALAIPREALVRTGRGPLVFVALGDGHFALRRVITGLVGDRWVEIKKGLSAGELVVTSGQFLMDSEAQVLEAAQKMAPPAKEKAPPPPADMDMSGMDMSDMDMSGMTLEGAQ